MTLQTNMMVPSLLFGLVIFSQARLKVRGLFCDTVSYQFINETRRSTAYKSIAPFFCDRGVIKNDHWYRFYSEAGNKMPITQPNLYRCGTYIPIWFNENVKKHPTVENQVVDAQACAAVPHASPEGCGFSYNIKVVKCPGNFYLYRLKQPRQCDFAYCAGTKLPEKCTFEPGTSTPLCPDAIPVVDKVIASASEDEAVNLKCTWKYSGNHATHVIFKVRWIGDENDKKRRVEREFNGAEKWEFLYRSENWALDGTYSPNADGYQFNKEPYCEVQTRYKDGKSWSKWKRSNKMYTGITVYPQIIHLDECGRRDITVTLRPNLPINKKNFVFEILLEDNSHVNKICVRGSMVPKSNICQTKLTTSHSFTKPMRIKLIASCSTVNHNTDGMKKFTFHNPVFVDANKFWRDYPFPPITVFVSHTEKKTCSSYMDPHFQSFDNRWYTFHAAGTFRLYKNPKTGTEVQTRQKYCGSSGTACCNCGVAIKEGLFYQIFDMCHIKDGDKPWWENLKEAVTIRKRRMQYSIKDGFNTTTRIDGTTTTFFYVDLPSGIKVQVRRNLWALSVYITAPKPTSYDIQGMCGNFNGNWGDDLMGKTVEEFAEHNRIPYGSRDDIFLYQGDKLGEDKIHEKCQEENLCICHSESSGSTSHCDPAAVLECFPKTPRNAAGNLHETTTALCAPPQGDTRDKRDLASRDDTIDDQDDIPPFNPIQRPRASPSWPTPSGLTKAKVTTICTQKVKNSKAGQGCATVTGVDINSIVESCILDIQATDNATWATDAFAAMDTSCRDNIYTNISYYKNSTDGELTLNTDIDILDVLCPNDCSDRGNCSNSTCICHEDYTAPDCSISLKDGPILFDIRKSGLCDVRRRPCRNVGIYGFPLLDSSSLTCHVQEYKVINSSWIPSNSISLFPGRLTDATEVKCSLPESPVNIGDYGNEGVTAAGLKIAVSNNGLNVSKDSMSFITYDSLCQECNTTTGCRLKNDSCIITGHCFAKNESHPDDWCQQCLPDISTTSWKKRRDNQRPTFTTSTVFYALHGKQLRVQLHAHDPENRAFRYSLVQNKTFGATLNKFGLFTWIKNTSEPTNFKFRVTDECGAFSTLNVSVMLKECPCHNSGECHPDYRYLDGAGNFTCSCPEQFTGTLCELDVNECNISKPCFNGTCKNEQPGFSCSCFVGYTDNLCQNEIDECASNPCFPGVSCTDMIAGFSCGPCLGGYSGDGRNCTKAVLDPCIKDPEICDSKAKCVYNNESYVCKCTQGYTGDGMKNNCTDEDECTKTPNICDPNASCTNTEGSYSCECLKGYTGDGKLNCSDVNECVQTPNVCYPKARCANTEGNYSCECLTGYTGDGILNCFDINECQQSPSACHAHANCSNNEGSFSCQCEDGYTGDGKVSCVDVNECQQTPSVCQPLANCSNSEGSYSCECKDGFTGNGQQCQDIDECTQSPSVCHAICLNTEGSFSCKCPHGYTGDGKINCTDIDECLQSSLVCHQHANCTNTAGSYSCKCYEGYLGDGKNNCTENKPPQFTTPRTVYVILSEDFRIQIAADDPEGKNMTYMLMLNGTLTTARITERGLLTIPNVTTSGTVYIQVKNEMGATNILVLQVNAMQCPCKQNGKCYQRKTNPYPVQPSDYLCQCEEPYTGNLCETRPNPCDEQPCYPGLKCSSAQNSEGFTCEKCPPLFDGDGKNCKLSTTQAKNNVKSKLTLTDEKWDNQLTNKASKVYKRLVSRVTEEIRKIYSKISGFSYVIIKGLRQGSVVVEFELVFTKKVDKPLEPLMREAKTGKLGNMTFEINESEIDKEEKDDNTILIVIVVAIVVFILILIIVIYLSIRRKRVHKEERLKGKENLSTKDTGARRTAYHEKREEEEMALKVFDKESVILNDDIDEIEP